VLVKNFFNAVIIDNYQFNKTNNAILTFQSVNFERIRAQASVRLEFPVQ